LLTLLESYGQVTSDAARTLHQLSYYSAASEAATPEALAVACVRLGCEFSGETFIHGAQMAQLGASRIEAVVGTLAKGLSTLAREPEREEVDLAYVLAQRGAYSGELLVTGIPSLAHRVSGVSPPRGSPASRKLAF
jgi:hypothetical protein